MSSPAISTTLNAKIAGRNALGERPANALFNLEESELYTGITAKSLRNLASGRARKLEVDGRGPKRSPLFKRSTLDAFLAGRS